MANERVGGIEWIVDADTTPAISSIKQFDAQVDRVETSLKGMDTQVSKTAKGVNTAMAGMSRGAGQAGIQMQQFIGQIQGGQDAMLALSQQAADIGFVLGAPLVGAIVGIGASLIGLAMNAMTTENAMASFIETLGDLDEEQLAGLTGQRQITAVTEFTDKLTEQETELNKLVDAQRRLEQTQTQVNQKIQEGGKVQTEMVSGVRGAFMVTRDYGKELDTVTESLARNAIAQQNLGDQIDETRKKLGLANDELNIYQDQINSAIRGAELMAQAHGKTGVELAEFNKQLAISNLEQKGATDEEIRAISVAHDMIIASVRRQEEEKATAQALRDRAAAQREADKAAREEERAQDRRRRDSAKRARGIGEAVGFAKDIVERGDARSSDVIAREKEQEQLEELRQKGLISEQLYQDALTQIREEGETARAESVAMALGSFSNSFDTMAQVFKDAKGEQSAGYKAMFALSKAFAVAQAGMNLALAISEAAKLPWPSNLPAIAQATAMGAQFIGAISGATFGGREHGGSVMANTPYEVGEKNKPELLMIPGNNGKVFSNAEVKGMMGGGNSGSNIVINNYNGSQVRARSEGEGLNRRDVIDILNAETSNTNTRTMRNITNKTTASNLASARRR